MSVTRPSSPVPSGEKPQIMIKTTAAQRAALLGVLCALAAALSFLEGLLPALPIPGAKLGLSNIVTMFALSEMGLPAALAVTLAKALFALFRGGSAFLMSLSGGVLSTLVMAGPLRLWHSRMSFVGIGVAGATAHNAGQLFVAMALLSPSLFYYAPWLLLMAIAAGTVTGLVLNAVMPAIIQLKRS